MQAIIVAASLAVALSAETGATGKSKTAITSNGGLMRQQREREPVAPWGWSVGDSWEGVGFRGATAPKKSVPLKFCMIHRDHIPYDTLCLFAGDSEGVVLKSFVDASEWQLLERQWNSHRPSNYTIRLIGPEFPTPDDLGDEAAGCEVNTNKQTCCLTSRLPVESGNDGRMEFCSTAATGGGGMPSNPDCLTTVVRQCEVTTTDGDTSMGWTFIDHRLMQRGSCLTRIDENYLEDAYSLSVQPCVDDELSPDGQRQYWNVHMKPQEAGDWQLVDPQSGLSLEPGVSE